MNRFVALTILFAAQAFAAPNPIREPEAWLDDALKEQGLKTTFRADVSFESLPEVPLQVEKERCYVVALIALEASNFPDSGVARWGSERGNAKQGEVFDGNYKIRVFDLGCTLNIRALKIALSAPSWPKGKGVVKVYTQTISASEYEAGLAKVAETQKAFKKNDAMNAELAKMDEKRRANMTCQGCANEYVACVRGASHAAATQSCGYSFDSCVENSDVIRPKDKKRCIVAKQ